MLFWTIGVGTILLLPFIHHYNKKHNRITADGVSRQLDAVNRESKIPLTPFKKKRSQVRFADEQTSVINHEGNSPLEVVIPYQPELDSTDSAPVILPEQRLSLPHNEKRQFSNPIRFLNRHRSYSY
ncbi:uncharacterized protein [Blastocystis hominis]|uniref:Uncharacterized protein n=1 Tax=Blastocystis hominis TaxID=12968 RepID=D8MBF2_BLAHO|nr:uncharacterized protein [Blastocystis hominis]CBK25391.2 unnamed protein product [Blastocystis hominis]|eukprot:XP_012899439.1 uncharacterized protein [Blastocystis hominis]